VIAMAATVVFLWQIGREGAPSADLALSQRAGAGTENREISPQSNAIPICRTKM
jgi:hypothetical protein